MRPSLGGEGQLTLARIQARCKELNPNTEPAFSAFMALFLKGLEAVLSKDQWASIAAGLTSERVKERLRRERLLELSARLDESDIEKLEAKIEKKKLKIAETVEKE